MGYSKRLVSWQAPIDMEPTVFLNGTISLNVGVRRHSQDKWEIDVKRSKYAMARSMPLSQPFIIHVHQMTHLFLATTFTAASASRIIMKRLLPAIALLAIGSYASVIHAESAVPDPQDTSRVDLYFLGWGWKLFGSDLGPADVVKRATTRVELLGTPATTPLLKLMANGEWLSPSSKERMRPLVLIIDVTSEDGSTKTFVSDGCVLKEQISERVRAIDSNFRRSLAFGSDDLSFECEAD
ncbi:MAG: hypothetical protein AB7E72_01500 [Lysobacterales bacterium]